MAERSKKLGIIIPYRNRREHLKEFTRRLQRYMEKFDIPYKVYVIDQDEAKMFNRGMLLNIGYTYAKKDRCDYIVFHDVDMMPVHVDYSYSETPLQMATHFIIRDDNTNRTIFDEYFGGVTMFPIEDFEKINGYSNKYWGWGFEDSDLLFRCRSNAIGLDNLRIKNMGMSSKSLKFNGYDSYVKCKNVFDTNGNLTFFVSFYPDEIVFDHTKEVDEFNVFTIPLHDYDFSICYNSFLRYNFCCFDEDTDVLYVNSNIKTNYKTNITVTVDNDNKIIKVYQDGYKIGETSFTKKLYEYNKKKHFYLGCGLPEKKSKFFKGHITSFAGFNGVLSDEEVMEISVNEHKDFRENFDDYHSSEKLKLYYKADEIEKYKLIDLTGNKNHGEIVNCEINNLSLTKYKIIKIPHRRESTFQLLPHKENGYFDNKWRYQATRWNQLRFNNEIKLNVELTKMDGLNTLEFIEHGKRRINEHITHINVGI